jgi:hypothetical protein
MHARGRGNHWRRTYDGKWRSLRTPNRATWGAVGLHGPGVLSESPRGGESAGVRSGGIVAPRTPESLTRRPLVGLARITLSRWRPATVAGAWRRSVPARTLTEPPAGRTAKSLRRLLAICRRRCISALAHGSLAGWTTTLLRGTERRRIMRPPPETARAAALTRPLTTWRSEVGRARVSDRASHRIYIGRSEGLPARVRRVPLRRRSKRTTGRRRAKSPRSRGRRRAPRGTVWRRRRGSKSLGLRGRRVGWRGRCGVLSSRTWRTRLIRRHHPHADHRTLQLVGGGRRCARRCRVRSSRWCRDGGSRRARARWRLIHQHRSLELRRRRALQVEAALAAGDGGIGVLSPAVGAEHSNDLARAIFARREGGCGRGLRRKARVKHSYTGSIFSSGLFAQDVASSLTLARALH